MFPVMGNKTNMMGGQCLVMEDPVLRERFEKALDSIVAKFSSDAKCLAAFLIGSMSHDLIWEWSTFRSW